ncbi:glycoside hydrolase domain-containing protein [Lactococcus petauri]|uniref:glycoside hydrolase domain-containing protein n=1 Tax=Lactococcus petauri TaxID=1940789 RepID=UPI0018A96304|nr:glycoside hydrolase domain-containing protein [Lactococcus petauri]MDC0826644.1 DUF1906 domain-containing protein [Lactococcus petauri]
MADELVLATQQWLNKTYGHIPDFNQAPEDGNTGWSTIYSLIEGLQVELGITALSPNFGDTTYRLYEQQITPNWNNLPTNVVYLIQGAFWCKGISPGGFDGIQTSALDAAVKVLQKDAGFTTQNGVLSAMWARALFDMSAFVLVRDPRVREMQQYLNANYYQYTGILPTDGIYQRATNTAIIYALQKEVGLDVETANGVFGPTTCQLYEQAYNSNWSSALSMIIQFGLYANMSEFWEVAGQPAPEFTGVLDSATAEGLSLFQDFLCLSPVVKGSPDLRTAWSLMTSNGDPNRTFWAVDTSIQLTDQNIADLVAFDVNYVGRYLTGTVGFDENERDKFLSREEADALLAAGLNIIPIYQDNFPTAEYYTRQQGRKDATTAMFTAAKLGIPDGGYIYFAVDFDALDTDIDNWVIPYFQGVREVLTSNQYNFLYHAGVYGTRNVCTRVYNEVGIQRSYVSNMSSGWSGNLGFSQPLNWAFDQFYESSYASVEAIDFVNVSGLDEGVSDLNPPVGVDEGYWINQTNWDWLKEPFNSGSIQVDGPSYTIFEYPGIMKAEVSVESQIKGDPNSTFTLEIEGGKLTPVSYETITKALGSDLGVVTANKIDEMSIGISNATIEVSAVIDLEGLATWRITLEFPEAAIEDVKIANRVVVEISFDFDSSTPEGNIQLAFSDIKLFYQEHATVINVSLIALGIAFLPLGAMAQSVTTLGQALLGLVRLLMPVLPREDDDD